MSWPRCVFISSAVLIISFLMTACGDLIVLLPDEQGKVGQLTVGEADNKVVLDSANETARVGSSGQTSKKATKN